MKRELLIAAILLLLSSLSWGSDSCKVIYGGFCNGTQFTNNLYQQLKDSLGCNIIVDNAARLTAERIQTLGNYGIRTIRSGFRDTDVCEPYGKYAYSFYAEIEAEKSESEQVAMRKNNGLPGGGYWICPRNATTLFYGPNNFPNPEGEHGYYLTQEKKYSSQIDPDTSVILYYASFFLKLDELNGVDSSIVAYLKVAFGSYNSVPDTLIVDTIYACELDTANWVELSISYNIPDTLDWATGVSHILEATGNKELYVDKIKLWDYLYGKELIENHSYDQEIVNSVQSFESFGDTIYGWYLRDEPLWGNLRSFGYIHNVITNSVYSGWNTVGLICSHHYYDYWFEAAGEDEMMIDFYPFTGNCSTGVEVSYYGFNGSPGWGNLLYFQNSLRRVSQIFGWVSASAQDSHGYWCSAPQSFDGVDDTLKCQNGENLHYWRRPTTAELSCQVFLALACGAKGIIYWPYFTSVYKARYNGLMAADLSKTELWYMVQDTITPYIMAVDDILSDSEFVWDTSYEVNEFYNVIPPFGNLIVSAKGYSEVFNPDSGWFHVGVFHDGNDDNYLFLVNRACSKDDQGAKAPSVTAIVEINRGLYQDAERLFVIDIAHEVDSNWHAIPETTYTTLYGSKLYFTTILKAGEGRLFKIAEVPSIPPIASISKYICQGGFKYSGTYTLPSSDTLQFKCPSKITFAANDTLIINGGLFTTGCNTDDSLGLVTFAADTSTIQWKGLLFDGSSATGDLSYCTVKNTFYHSIQIADSARVKLKNSTIKDSQYGVHLASSGKLDARDCFFEKGQSGAYGIYNQSGDSVLVNNCIFKKYSDYAILSMDGYLKADSCEFDSLSFFAVDIESAEAEILSSVFSNIAYYGLYGSNADLTVKDCAFNQIGYCGIILASCADTISGSTFESIDNYGIYVNYSESVIDACTLSFCEDYGIYIYSNPGGNYDTTKITNCKIQTGLDQITIGSQYGIRANGIDRLFLKNNLIRTYHQGGIYLYGSDAVVGDQTIRSMGVYGIYANGSDADIDSCVFDSLTTGIYCSNGSSPTINYCLFDSVDIGAYIYGQTCLPDLGDTSAVDGNNDFAGCTDYFIYQVAATNPPPLIKAEMNYFGSGEPDPDKFEGNIDYIPYRPNSPFAKAIQRAEIPSAFQLNQSYPNPFNPNAVIQYGLSKPGYTTLAIYNILGQKITILVDDHKQPGNYTVIWDGRDRYGQAVASGIYFYRLESGNFVDTKKMLLLR